MPRTKTEDTEVVNAIAPEKDPWSEMKTIILPKGQKGEDNFQLCSVNGRVYKVKKGTEVEVPMPIYQVLMNSMKDAEVADSFIEQSMFE